MRSLCVRGGPKPLAAPIAAVSTEDEEKAQTLRAYQMEMLQASLDGNVIVVVCSTGPLQSNSLTSIIDGHGQRQNPGVCYSHLKSAKLTHSSRRSEQSNA
jgi:hypothetical protein